MKDMTRTKLAARTAEYRWGLLPLLLVSLLLGPVLLAPLTAPALAQEEPPRDPQAEFEGEVDVTEVLLDVLVTDKQGNVIVGLDEDDFIVTEGGEPVDVESVTFYSNLRLTEEAAAAEGEKPADFDETLQERYFIFFFHDQRIAATEVPGLLARQLDAMRQAQRWVEEEMLPRDYVAVAGYDFKLKVYSDFTRDRQALLEAIERAGKGEDDGNWPSRIDESDPLSLRARLPKGKQLRKETKRIYEGLEELAQAAGAIPGRKNLILFTLGFGELDSFGRYRRDQRFYPSMIRTLNDNNVAVYTIDLAPAGSRHVMEAAMNDLASDTGGDYHFNFTSFITPLQQISEKTGGYYLLSYRSRHPAGESGYQEVKVDTRNPEFRVRSRDGYLYGE